MRQSSLLIEQLSQDVQDVNYEDYLSLFDRLDYKNKEFQALIEAEITANDDFIQKTPEELIQSLELPSNATLYEIKIAYLKQQMGFMVERLKSNAAHNLRADQVLLLKGQARLILMHLNTLEPWQYAEFNRILITLTLCTGSRCSRAYLECFAGILRDNSIIQGREQLSFTERVIVQTQKIKSKAFMNYYYNLTGVVKKSCKSTNNPFGENVGVLFWADSQDYHSYEDFALQFGPFFYLDNTSLSCRMRGILDLFPDAYVAYNSKEMPQISFNYYYNESVLIDEVINGELSADFVKWCNTFYPHAYEDFCLDDEFMPYPKHDLKMRALARLMLLDCHIIQFREPCSLILAHEKQQHHHIRFSYGM